MEIPLVSDVDHSIMTAYGCKIEDDSGERHAAFRATYIIDRDGIHVDGSVMTKPRNHRIYPAISEITRL